MSKQLFMGNVAELRSKLWSLDLDPMIVKVMDEKEGKGLSYETSLSAVEEYRRFLFLTVTRKEIIVPTKFVDEIWHAHILDTEKYRTDCQHLFGFFLDHFPYFGMRGDDDQEALQSAFAEAAGIYEQTFGSSYHVGLMGANCGTCGYGNCSPVDDLHCDVIQAHRRPTIAAGISTTVSGGDVGSAIDIRL